MLLNLWHERLDMRADDLTAELQLALDRLLAGEAVAGHDLVGLAYERLRLLAHTLLAGYDSVARWEETDDVLQNSALRLCRALESVRPASAAEFFGLAALQIRRELVDLARHHNGPEGHAAHELSGDLPAEMVGDGGFSDPTDGPLTLIEWTDFHSLVERLPEKERQTFDLIYYGGLTQEQAAEALGVAVRTVKRRWRDARLALSKALDGRPPGK